LNNGGKCDKCKESYNSLKEIRIKAKSVLNIENQIVLSYINEDLPKRAEKYFSNSENGEVLVIRLCRAHYYEVKKDLLKKRKRKK